jgi:hypothetical protein
MGLEDRHRDLPEAKRKTVKKILYLLDQPFDAQNFSRFGILDWERLGWSVKVWDFTPWLHREVWIDFHAAGRTLQLYDGLTTMFSRTDFLKALGDLAPIGYFIDVLDDTSLETAIKRRIVRSGGVRILLGFGQTPAPVFSEPAKALALLRKGPRRVIRRIARSFNQLLFGRSIRPAFFVASGAASVRRGQAVKSREIIQAHSFDYDAYRRSVASAAPPQSEYAVFLDQNLCFHSDFLYLKNRHYVSEENYFPTLARGFQRIERELALNVVVAAHPRTPERDAERDCFGGRPSIRGQTVELIRHAKLVIAHYSTAIQFAVLFEKPILFVTTDELAATLGGRFTESFSAALGGTTVNLDRDLDLAVWPTTHNAARYRAYREEYVKVSGSPENSYWEIVVQRLETAVATSNRPGANYSKAGKRRSSSGAGSRL